MTNGSAVSGGEDTRDNENVVTRAANTRNNGSAVSTAGGTRDNENVVTRAANTRNNDNATSRAERDNGNAVTHAANTRNNNNATSRAGITRSNDSATSRAERDNGNAVPGVANTRSNDGATSGAGDTRNNDNAVTRAGDTRNNNNAVTYAANTRNNDNAVSGAGDTRNNQNTTSTAHIEKYYNKFNEDHRLTTRHGIVEFTVTMQAIEDCAEELRLARGDTRHNDNATSLAEGALTLHNQNVTSAGALTRHNQNVVTSDEITRNNDSTTSDAGVTLHNNNPPSLAEGALTLHSNNVVSTPGVTLHSNNVVSSAEGALHNNNPTSLAEGALTRHNQNPSPLPLKIADIGAGTGRYSIALAQKGYDVTAVELVKRNLEVLRSKHQNVKTWQGDARNLHFLPDNTFDITLLFGPLYHLHGTEEKLKAIKEAMRITKKGGKILIAYVMNEYSVISYCFKTHHWQEVAQKNGITADFHTISAPDELYDYVRLSDINELNQLAGLKRQKIIAPDGPADYMRRELNEMSDSEFQAFIDFQKANCARPELLGASSHIVDICTF